MSERTGDIEDGIPDGFEPAASDSDSGDGTERIDLRTVELVKPAGKRRGRKPGRRAGNGSDRTGSTRTEKTSSQTFSVDLETVEMGLILVHAWVAEKVKQPAIALDESQAHALAKAGAHALSFVSVIKHLTPAQQALAAFGIVAGGIYVGKGFEIWMGGKNGDDKQS